MPADAAAPLPDSVARLHKQLARLFVEFGDEVLDCVRDSKGVDVEDVRRAMVDPLRDAHPAPGAADEYASCSRPMPRSASNGDAS